MISLEELGARALFLRRLKLLEGTAHGRAFSCVGVAFSSPPCARPPRLPRQLPAPDTDLNVRKRQHLQATAARGTAGGGVRGGLGAQERVGGSCEIGGRLRGRLDHPPPPPSARSCLLAGATGHKKRQDGRLRLQGVRRGLHRPLETVKHVFKRLTAKAAGDGWAKEGGEGSKRRKEMQRG